MRLFPSDSSSTDASNVQYQVNIEDTEEVTPILIEDEGKMKGKFLYQSDEENNDEINETIGSIFVQTALMNENALAVIQMNENLNEPTKMNYDQLSKQVNILAHRLIFQYNIKIGDVVCQCMERSLDMVIALLAIISVGGVYCPINPTDPKDRILFLIETTKAKLILLQNSTEHIFNNINININKYAFNYKDHLMTNNEMYELFVNNVDVKSTDMACIIFTSGSTGKPKGVPLSHLNVLNHWRGIHQSLDNDKPMRYLDDITLAIGVTTFDISINEVLCSLLLGSHFVLLSPRGHLDSSYIIDTIEKQKITQFFIVPSSLRILLDFIEKQNCSQRLSSLRSVWCGGEIVTNQLADQFYKTIPLSLNIDLINGYGPTECTVFSTYHRITINDIQSDILPIGRPFFNYSCYILDENLLPVLPGTIGELFIGGKSVFNGYLVNGNEDDIIRLEKLNSRILVNIPNLSNHHNKSYRTGDLCRYNAKGEIIYIGRIDHQVKLRGQRLELGEIESSISSLPFISYCVANKCTDQTTQHEYLVAYVQCSSFSSNFIKETIEQHCRSSLPAYMVPSVIMILDKIPLNTNGKIDRKQLPIPQIENIVCQHCEYKEASNEFEYLIHKHWSTVLGIDKISMNANFFSLGGNSLLLMRLIGIYRTENIIKSNLNSIDLFFKQATLIEHVQLILHLEQNPNDTINNDKWLPLNQNESEASSAQQRIWLDEQLRYSKSSKYAMYNVVIPIMISQNNSIEKSNIKLDRIHRALLTVIRRHKVLRTSIKHEMNIIKQYVNPMPKYIINNEERQLFYQFIESSYSSDEQLKQILSYEVIGHVFNIEKGLVVRFNLIRKSFENIGKNDLFNQDILSFNIHHAAIDGESKIIFLRHLELAYHNPNIFGINDGEDLFQYIDYTIHESNLFKQNNDSSSLNEAKAYWKECLDGCLDKHLSICQNGRILDTEENHGNYSFDLSNELVFELVSLSVKNNLSLYQMCLSAYVLYIHKLTNEYDICVGGVTANRYRSEQDDLIGMFVNLLPYRIKIDKNNIHLKTYYKYVQKICLDFMRYGQLPLQDIVKLHRTSHHQLEYSPFFQTTLAFYSNTSASHLGRCLFDDIICESINPPISVVKFDLCLVINHTLLNNIENQYKKHTMNCKWEYSTRFYHIDQIKILTERFISFLNSLIDATKITQLSVMISKDFKAIRQLNNNYLHFNNITTIDQHFNINVQNNPYKTAIIYNNLHFTYHEINEKAIKLANYLIKSCDVHPGDVILQCISRSVEMVIGILAILKAQAIYCPLNPADPSQRHILLMNDIKSNIILCDKLTYSNFQTNLNSIRILNTNEILLNSTIETNELFQLESIGTSDDLAYIVHTSGSTGKPKSVPISNGNFLTCIRGMQHLKMINSSDIIAQITECSYDVHLMELLACLVTGGTLIMLKQHGNMDMEYLANIIQQYKVTWAILVPTLALSLYEQVSNNIQYNDKLKSLTTCISGGEAMSPITIKNLLPYFSTNVQVYNVYGPAEASMASTIHLIDSKDLLAKFVPIGRPLPNYSCHILDKDLCPVPVGAIGELFIGGPGVFKGYRGPAHNNNNIDEDDHIKKLNAQVLVDIPMLHSQSVEKHHHNKFYRTGDLCRLNDDGEIVFIGRVDHQVKIRGQRLELGEIEACIRSANTDMNIRNCLVIKSIDDLTHREYLGAYVQPAYGTSPTTYTTLQANLTKHCMQHLPAHMVPSSWLFLDTFPLNSNDKIDRKQLPPLPLRTSENNRQTSKTSNNLEDVLREIYSTTLNIDIDEEQFHMSFIELGGTSLTAMTMVQLIRQRVYAQMEISLLFKNPSIHALATILHSYQTHLMNTEKYA